jgi:hypothetical protein
MAVTGMSREYCKSRLIFCHNAKIKGWQMRANFSSLLQKIVVLMFSTMAPKFAIVANATAQTNCTDLAPAQPATGLCLFRVIFLILTWQLRAGTCKAISASMLCGSICSSPALA